MRAGLSGLMSMLMLATAVPAAPAREPGPFRIGEPFPVRWLPDAADGRPVSLAELRGRKLVLHVFASW